MICAGSIVVSISRCQRGDPGPNPGLRIPQPLGCAARFVRE
jgi:hypothetical protein